ncbi:MAG: hypothetical protein ACL93V_08725 [Candidatus Electrothrix sp. YB6]
MNKQGHGCRAPAVFMQNDIAALWFTPLSALLLATGRIYWYILPAKSFQP